MTSRSEIITFLVSILMFFIMGNNLGPFPSASDQPEGKKQGKCNYGSEYARDSCKPNDFGHGKSFGTLFMRPISTLRSRTGWRSCTRC